MSLSSPFIRRPVGTSLLALGLLLAGLVAFRFLPIAPLPEVEYPTISVYARLPGADPVTVASSVTTPLERHLGQIAGITEMTSYSSLGSANINLQFDLDRSIDSCARDVQAAINAASADLPANLVTRPTYRKANPAAAPVMILALTSDSLDPGTVYNFATDVLAQALSQVKGVAEVDVSGAEKSAIRVQVDPAALAARGLSMEDVRAFLAKTNANLPKGQLNGRDASYTLKLNDQLTDAASYRNLVAFERNGTAVRLGDLGAVVDSVENTRQAGWYNGKPAVLIIIFKEAGANVIETADGIRGLIPQLEAWMPPAVRLHIQHDRTGTIRSSVNHIELTLMVSIALVVMTVFVFLRRFWATLIPSFTVPLSLAGTFGIMYLAGYTLDNLSLMALAVAVGFVVDDAIVVLENIVRHIEEGLPPRAAALLGARQIGFTVVAITLSLVAVFIPVIFMQGLVGRLLHEFAVTLTAAIVVSCLVSLTFTPMMCGRFLRHEASEDRPGRLFRALEAGFDGLQRIYARALAWVLRHEWLMLTVTVITMGASAALYVAIPKGFFPSVDTGFVRGGLQARQDTSFLALRAKQQEATRIILRDPAVESVASFMSGGSNFGRMFIQLKPLSERPGITEVIARLEQQLAGLRGANVYLRASTEIRVGARESNGTYQYTLQGSDLDALAHWSGELAAALSKLPQFQQVSSDRQSGGLQAQLDFDRTAIARYGLTLAEIDAVLYDSFGQRQVSTIYTSLTQHHVILESTPAFQLTPDALKQIYVKSSAGAMVPLSAIARLDFTNTPLAISHQGQFPALTISFNLPDGYSLDEAAADIDRVAAAIHMPGEIHGSFQGNAKAIRESSTQQLWLIAGALVAVYVILGMLYESLIHPLTILSTLPSAGVGALLSLMLMGYDLSIVALIGILLLIGIVKKNAIMMIDFALELERGSNLAPEEAIRRACIVRFRPIMMTTAAALFGALPLALERGEGAELHHPLGVAIIGGLILSQLLTLFTTPVVYVALDQLRRRFSREGAPAALGEADPA